MDIFPGTFNLHINRELSLLDPCYSSRLILMDRREYGGRRGILMLPCVLPGLGARRALIWRTTAAEADPVERATLEILAEVHLRSTYDLSNDDNVEVRIELDDAAR